jgi:hypothetical protein
MRAWIPSLAPAFPNHAADTPSSHRFYLIEKYMFFKNPAIIFFQTIAERSDLAGSIEARGR